MSLKSFEPVTCRDRLMSLLREAHPKGRTMFQLANFLRFKHEYREVADAVVTLVTDGRVRGPSNSMYWLAPSEVASPPEPRVIRSATNEEPFNGDGTPKALELVNEWCNDRPEDS